jgi:hypothetical protein
MGIDPNSLPQDAATLRSLVTSLLEDRATQERRIRQLQHMLEQLLRARYGPRRERLNENQLFLFAVKILADEKNESSPKEKSGSDRPKPEIMRSKRFYPRTGDDAFHTLAQHLDGRLIHFFKMTVGEHKRCIRYSIASLRSLLP